jgi:hypothetical protein
MAGMVTVVLVVMAWAYSACTAAGNSNGEPGDEVVRAPRSKPLALSRSVTNAVTPLW